MKKLKVLELFGGIGSARKALENLNIPFEIIDYVELDPIAVDAVNHIFNENYTPTDIKEWKWPDVVIDLVVFGSPCQDFSPAGKNDMSSGRSILYRTVLELIENLPDEKRPRFVIWENVKALMYKNNIEHFNYYSKTMEKLGYKSDSKLLNSKDFGIAQSRNRWFTLSCKSPKYSPTTILNLIKTIPTKPLFEFLDNNVDECYYVRQKSMINAIKHKKIKLINNICETIRTGTFKWNCSGFATIELRKYDSHNRVYNIENGIAPTLTTNHGESPFKIATPILDQSIPNIPVFLIDNKPYHLRVLTEKECWRLMGWEDKDFNKISHISKNSKYRLSGNAIVIQVLESIFKELLKEENND